MIAVYFPTSGYINVAFRKEGMIFPPIFLLKCLRGRETENRGNVCTSYLEGKEIAGIAENGEDSGERPSPIRGELRKEKTKKIGNRKYEVRNRRCGCRRERDGESH